MVVHKHWFVVMQNAIIFVFLLFVPALVFWGLPYLSIQFDPEIFEPLVNALLSLYIMVLLLLLFLLWMDYYLDMWIITDRRIIDIDQRGLFDREVSEIPLDHIQDVTIEVRGLIETFLKFGTIRIQTAGEREFLIETIPHLDEVKTAILKIKGEK